MVYWPLYVTSDLYMWPLTSICDLRPLYVTGWCYTDLWPLYDTDLYMTSTWPLYDTDLYMTSIWPLYDTDLWPLYDLYMILTSDLYMTSIWYSPLYVTGSVARAGEPGSCWPRKGRVVSAGCVRGRVTSVRLLPAAGTRLSGFWLGKNTDVARQPGNI